MSTTPVALITGGAQRIGAEMARTLHRAGYRVAIHYCQSEAAARALCTELNGLRADSAAVFSADLADIGDVEALAERVLRQWQRVDVLINNASGFFPTPIGSATGEDWDKLFGSNLKGPFFLAQALAPALADSTGCIVNIVDIYADKPLREHSLYCMAKAGLAMMTRALAQELGPAVRVNGIAPGAILWPEQSSDFGEQEKRNVLSRVPLKRKGDPQDIARTVLFLVRDAPYISGQIIAVDGGRSVFM